jgi:hypothetical protein
VRCEGIPFGPKPKLTPSPVEYAIELLDNGKILAAVARLLGVERIPRLWRPIKRSLHKVLLAPETACG